MELLVVIAIIAVLVAIAIPMLASQLEKSREATDLANVRSAYAQVSAVAILGDTTATVTVDLKQREADWQSVDPVNIGGIVHSSGDADTDNWIGTATPGGSCEVSYSESYGVVLTWSGSAAPSEPDYPFDTSVKDYFSPLLYATDFWESDTLAENKNFELDSRCPNSVYIPSIKAELAKMNNSLCNKATAPGPFWEMGVRSRVQSVTFSGLLSTQTRSAPESRSLYSFRPVTENTMFPKPRQVSEQIKKETLMSRSQKVSS